MEDIDSQKHKIHYGDGALVEASYEEVYLAHACADCLEKAFDRSTSQARNSPRSGRRTRTRR